jgi:hypothetical protein
MANSISTTSTNNNNQKFTSSTYTSLELSEHDDHVDSKNDSGLFAEDFVDQRIDHDPDEDADDVAYEMALQKRAVLMKRRQQRHLVTAALLLLVVSLLLGFFVTTLFFRKKPTIMQFSSSLWIETTLPSSGRRILSVSISEDGLVAAAADGNALLVWQQHPGGGMCESLEAPTIAAQWVALSGDGQLIAMATPVHNGTHLRVTSTTNMPSWNEEPIASYYCPNKYVITDLALDRNGTTLAVGYGMDWTAVAEYDMGDGRAWKWTHSRPSGVDLYDRRYDDETPDPDHYKEAQQQFDTEFQGDNFGTRVQINADGTRVMQSTEHSPYDRSASLLYKDLDMDTWYGIEELFRFGNTSACDDVASDVGISSDGSIVVIALLCGQKKKKKQVATTTKLYVYTYRGEVGDPDRWTPLTDQPLTRSLPVDTRRYHHHHKMVPFSIALSGDASTLVLATPDVLEVLQWNRNSSSSSSGDNRSLAVADVPYYWETLNEWKDNSNGVEYLPALSSDGSRLFLARNDVASGTGSLRYLDLWTKRNDTDRGFC